jgi:hypothetical protein
LHPVEKEEQIEINKYYESLFKKMKNQYNWNSKVLKLIP